MVLIITGTINVQTGSMNTVICDSQIRLKQYEDGITKLIESKAVKKIVFCENSGFDMSMLSPLQVQAKDNGIQLELLSFTGNAKETARHGKGYGEGEIMKYVFQNSKLVADEDYFVKLTGRLQVDNLSKMWKAIDIRHIYFNIPNRTHREMYDTRLYAMPVSTFKEFFINKYEEVMDAEGYYLEKVYTKVILDYHMNIRNFPYYPRIVGISGSNGATYTYTEWKCKIKDILSRFGFYKVKEKKQ